jgi:hypothetical protein
MANRRELIEALRACRAFMRTPGAVKDLTTAVVLLRAVDELLDGEGDHLEAERALLVRCDECGVDAGHGCITAAGAPARGIVHHTRILFARRVAAMRAKRDAA